MTPRCSMLDSWFKRSLTHSNTLKSLLLKNGFLVIYTVLNQEKFKLSDRNDSKMRSMSGYFYIFYNRKI